MVPQGPSNEFTVQTGQTIVINITPDPGCPTINFLWIGYTPTNGSTADGGLGLPQDGIGQPWTSMQGTPLFDVQLIKPPVAGAAPGKANGLIDNPKSGTSPIPLPGNNALSGPIPSAEIYIHPKVPNVAKTLVIGWGDCKDTFGASHIQFAIDPGPEPPPTQAQLGATDATLGEPVSTAAGEAFDAFEDLFVDGPMPLHFTRFYASSLAAEGQITGSLGTNWLHTFDEQISVNGSTAEVVVSHGRAIIFDGSGTTWTTASGYSYPWAYQLEQSGSTFTFYDPEAQTVRTFDGTTGLLQQIADRHGNALTLAYSGTLLTTVSDGRGAAFAFTYAEDLLTQVADSGGRSVSFTYGTDLSLASCTDAIGKTTTYTYTEEGGQTGLVSSITRPLGNAVFTNTFDVNGRVVSQSDAAANTFTLAFATAASSQTTVTDPTSAKAVHTYAAGTRDLTALTDGLGNTLALSYDAAHRRTKRVDQNGGALTFAYDPASGGLSSVTFPDGSTKTITYSAAMSGGFAFYDVSQIQFPDGSTEQLAYNAAGLVTSFVDRSGGQWSFTYDAAGRPLTRVFPNGGVASYTWNANETLATRQLPGTGAVTHVHDALRRPIGITLPDGATWSFTWDALDRVTSVTDELGGIATNAYDDNGFLIQRGDQTGATWAYAPTPNEKVASVVDPLGNMFTFSYDPLDRYAGTSYPDGSVESIGYDAAGNPTTFVDGEGHTWSKAYDKAGSEIARTTPGGKTVHFALDSMSRIQTITTATSGAIALTYDKDGNITNVTDALGAMTSIAYDGLGNIVGYVAPGGLTTTYTRDPIGSITKVTDPNGSAWSYARGPGGHWLGSTDPLGNTLTLTRDTRGHVAGATFPGGGTVTITRDPAANPTHEAYSDGAVIDLAYDARSRIISGTNLTLARDPIGAIVSSNGIAATRDALGRPRTVTLAAGKVVTYAYDKRGLVTSVSDWLAGSTALSYDADGRLSTVTRPNGVVTTYAYDADGNVVSTQEATPTTTLATATLSRDARGSVASADRTTPLDVTAAQLATLEASQAFDAASQVTAFSYDGLGRRTSDGQAKYAWDLASRATSVTVGTTTTQYAYDALGAPISESTATTPLQYVWNYGFALPAISVVRQAGADLRYYVHTPDGSLLYSIDAAAGARHYHHYDELGNTTFLTDDTATVTDSYAYSPYGALLAASGTTENPFTYGGKHGAMRIGATSTLYRMGGRIYDASTAAFVSRDPGARLGAADPYPYADGDPLGKIDVTGAEPEPAGAGEQGETCEFVEDLSTGAEAVEKYLDLFEGESEFNRFGKPPELPGSVKKGVTAFALAAHFYKYACQIKGQYNKADQAQDQAKAHLRFMVAKHYRTYKATLKRLIQTNVDAGVLNDRNTVAVDRLRHQKAQAYDEYTQALQGDLQDYVRTVDVDRGVALANMEVAYGSLFENVVADLSGYGLGLDTLKALGILTPEGGVAALSP
jgi:RHS repeat-associated protein